MSQRARQFARGGSAARVTGGWGRGSLLPGPRLLRLGAGRAVAQAPVAGAHDERQTVEDPTAAVGPMAAAEHGIGGEPVPGPASSRACSSAHSSSGRCAFSPTPRRRCIAESRCARCGTRITRGREAQRVSHPAATRAIPAIGHHARGSWRGSCAARERVASPVPSPSPADDRGNGAQRGPRVSRLRRRVRVTFSSEGGTFREKPRHPLPARGER